MIPASCQNREAARTTIPRIRWNPATRHPFSRTGMNLARIAVSAKATSSRRNSTPKAAGLRLRRKTKLQSSNPKSRYRHRDRNRGTIFIPHPRRNRKLPSNPKSSRYRHHDRDRGTIFIPCSSETMKDRNERPRDIPIP